MKKKSKTQKKKSKNNLLSVSESQKTEKSMKPNKVTSGDTTGDSKETDNLAKTFKNSCELSASTSEKPLQILFNKEYLSNLNKWPKLKIKVPFIFVHRPFFDFAHIRKIVNKGIKIYQPYLQKHYLKFRCESFEDHKALTMYLDKNNLPYHTFGHPMKRKMKVVIRGLPVEIDLNKLKAVLKSNGIPIIRLHKMHTKVTRKENFVVLAVVPYDDEGWKLLTLEEVNNNSITLEPPISKVKQCHRCQKWGHSQRYCHGIIKCLKCAGDHLSKKCTRNREEEPPKCANCGGEHTANYKQCSYCPESKEFQLTQFKKQLKCNLITHKPYILTLENCDKNLFRNLPQIESEMSSDEYDE